MCSGGGALVYFAGVIGAGSRRRSSRCFSSRGATPGQIWTITNLPDRPLPGPTPSPWRAVVYITWPKIRLCVIRRADRQGASWRATQTGSMFLPEKQTDFIFKHWPRNSALVGTRPSAELYGAWIVLFCRDLGPAECRFRFATSCSGVGVARDLLPLFPASTGHGDGSGPGGRRAAAAGQKMAGRPMGWC